MTGVELTKEVVDMVSAAVKDISPEVWRAMMIQQYIWAVGGLLVYVMLFFFGRWGYTHLTNVFPMPRYPGGNIDFWNNTAAQTWGLYFIATKFIPAVFLLVYLMSLTNSIVLSVSRVANPAFYAIQQLVSIAK